MTNHYIDLFVRNTPEPVYCYRSGLTTYEERFLNGILASGGWNAAGYPLNVLSNYPTHIDLAPFAEISVFHLEIDGECVDYALELVSADTIERNNGSKEVVLTLKSSFKPAEITVHTLMDGTAMFSRWLTVKNLSEEPMAISRLSVFSGALDQKKNFSKIDPTAKPEEIYELGYFERQDWGSEGDLQWRPLPFDKTTFGGRFARSRYRHPAFFLKNKLTGMIFFGQLGWTAGYDFSFDYIADRESTDVSLGIDIAVTGHNPIYLLQAGETFTSPQVHIGTLFGGLDEAVNASYDHIRRSVLNLPEADGSACLIGSGMGPEHDMSVETTKRFMDQMAEVGAELFIIDAGWYCPPNKETEWGARNGDWYADPDRYPNGIAEVREYAHSKGLKFGMWMESERIGPITQCRAAHPDWFTYDINGQTDTGLVDFTNPEAVAWVEEQIIRVITDYQLDLFRIDYNISAWPCFFIKDGKRRECGSVRHYQNVYAMYERLKKRFPHVIFENCAGGGGRTDLAMLRTFNHSWVSDWQNAPRSLYITSGMTMVVPPERVDRLVSGMGCHAYASLDFQMRNAMLGHLTLNVLSPAAADFNPEQLTFIKHSTDLYKNFIRPFLPTARMYHHIDDISGAREKGWTALELTAADRSRAAISVFTLPMSKEQRITVIPRGLDLSRRYRITLDNSGATFTADGAALASNGITLLPLTAMRSELILLETID